MPCTVAPIVCGKVHCYLLSCICEAKVVTSSLLCGSYHLLDKLEKHNLKSIAEISTKPILISWVCYMFLFPCSAYLVEISSDITI